MAPPLAVRRRPDSLEGLGEHVSPVRVFAHEFRLDFGFGCAFSESAARREREQHVLALLQLALDAVFLEIHTNVSWFLIVQTNRGLATPAS